VRTDMSEDFDFIRSRIPTYLGYGSEEARHDSDKRVRAIVGEALSDAGVRFTGALDPKAAAAYEELLMQCAFTDQGFVRKYEHGKLTDGTLAALMASDRILVELEEQVMNASTVDELNALVTRIHEQFARRREPLRA
jgi:hypothetical protein